MSRLSDTWPSLSKDEWNAFRYLVRWLLADGMSVFEKIRAWKITPVMQHKIVHELYWRVACCGGLFYWRTDPSQGFAACSVSPSRNQSQRPDFPEHVTLLGIQYLYSIRCPRIQRSLLASESSPVKLLQCCYRPYCRVMSSTMNAWRCF